MVPPVETMTPALLAKIKQLADAGAMIIGGARSRRASRLAWRIWARAITKFGKPPPSCGLPVKSSRARPRRNFWPSAACRRISPPHPLLRHIHRRSGDADVYFVANPGTHNAIEAVAEFRISGKQPELWWPDSGRMEKSVSFRESKGVTARGLASGAERFGVRGVPQTVGGHRPDRGNAA